MIPFSVEIRKRPTAARGLGARSPRHRAEWGGEKDVSTEQGVIDSPHDMNSNTIFTGMLGTRSVYFLRGATTCFALVSPEQHQRLARLGSRLTLALPLFSNRHVQSHVVWDAVENRGTPPSNPGILRDFGGGQDHTGSRCHARGSLVDRRSGIAACRQILCYRDYCHSLAAGASIIDSGSTSLPG